MFSKLKAVVLLAAVAFAVVGWSHRSAPAPAVTRPSAAAIRKADRAVKRAEHHACLAAALAYAGTGAGIQGGPVRLGYPLLPGHSYALPAFYITNPGSGDETMTLRVMRLPGACGRVILPQWVSGTGQSFGLGAGQDTQVHGLVLRIPSDALPGRYESDIVVYGSAGGAGASPGGRAVLGAGASTHLIIHVARRQA